MRENPYIGKLKGGPPVKKLIALAFALMLSAAMTMPAFGAGQTMGDSSSSSSTQTTTTQKKHKKSHKKHSKTKKHHKGSSSTTSTPPPQ